MSNTFESEEQKFTKDELEKMTVGYGTPIRDAAKENAEAYDYDSDTLDVAECVEDAFVYGAIWVLEHLQG